MGATQPIRGGVLICANSCDCVLPPSDISLTLYTVITLYDSNVLSGEKKMGELTTEIKIVTELSLDYLESNLAVISQSRPLGETVCNRHFRNRRLHLWLSHGTSANAAKAL